MQAERLKTALIVQLAFIVEIGIAFKHPKYAQEYLLPYVIIKQDVFTVLNMRNSLSLHV